MEINIESIYLPSEQVVARKIEDEIIIVPIQDGIADFDDAIFSLNETGQKVWEFLSEEVTLKEICNRLATIYDADVKEITKDVNELIKILLEKTLIIEKSDE